VDDRWARERQSERARLATSLDRELIAACRMEATLRRQLGEAAAALLAGRGHQRLGFVRASDYARERLGVSARTLQSAAWLATRLDTLALVGTAFDRSEITWTQARIICGVATNDDQSIWLERARHCTTRALETLARSTMRSGNAAPDPDADDGLTDGEPTVRFRLTCPSRIRALWRYAVRLAARVAGETLAPWRAAEAIAAEAFSGRPADSRFEDRALIGAMRLARRALRKGGDKPSTDVADHSVSPTIASGDEATIAAIHRARPPDRASHEDPFALDARLVDAIGALRKMEPQIGNLLRLLVDHHLYKALGFRSIDAYVRERLGISARKAWALLAVDRATRRAAPFARHYEDGRLSWVRALALLPVLQRENADAWIARAESVTVRRLADEVEFVLARRDALGFDATLDPPPADAELTLGAGLHIGAHAESPSNPSWGRKSSLADVCDAEIRFKAPASVVALLRETLDVYARPDEPRCAALEHALRHVITHWESGPRHRDPVFTRDDWRCRVPGCTSRRNLHDHHIHFRSRGGDNDRSNRITICAAHHLHGIHGGTIRAEGRAPDDIRWELGIRGDRPALLSYVGDRLAMSPSPP
jgi:hypothetical protein